jgi:hypothetical protein
MDRLVSIIAFVRVAESGAPPERFDRGGQRECPGAGKHARVRLLNRTTRRVSLTEIGRDYYERCVQILHDLEEADETAGALQLTPRGRLRLHCHHAI